MSLDNKISFFGGYIFTTVSSVSLLGFVNAAIIGLIGGFFGLLGKEVYYYIKGEIKDKINDSSKTK
jgi:hypothetical protein